MTQAELVGICCRLLAPKLVLLDPFLLHAHTVVRSFYLLVLQVTGEVTCLFDKVSRARLYKLYPTGLSPLPGLSYLMYSCFRQVEDTHRNPTMLRKVFSGERAPGNPTSANSSQSLGAVCK